jgi:hypothetical protein
MSRYHGLYIAANIALERIFYKLSKGKYKINILSILPIGEVLITFWTTMILVLLFKEYRFCKIYHIINSFFIP